MLKNNKMFPTMEVIMMDVDSFQDLVLEITDGKKTVFLDDVYYVGYSSEEKTDPDDCAVWDIRSELSEYFGVHVSSWHASMNENPVIYICFEEEQTKRCRINLDFVFDEKTDNSIIDLIVPANTQPEEIKKAVYDADNYCREDDDSGLDLYGANGMDSATLMMALVELNPGWHWEYVQDKTELYFTF